MSDVYLLIAENFLSVEDTAQPFYVVVNDVPTSSAQETPESIKAKYESNADTNVFSDSNSQKLTDIEDEATADQSGAELVSSITNELGGSDWQSTAAAVGPQYVMQFSDGSGSFSYSSTLFTDSASALHMDNLVISGGEVKDANLYMDGVTLTISASGFNAAPTRPIALRGDRVYYQNQAGVIYGLIKPAATGFDIESNFSCIRLRSDIVDTLADPSGTMIDNILVTTKNIVDFRSQGAVKAQIDKDGVFSSVSPSTFLSVTTAQRTALPNAENTTVFDTDLKKLYCNDGVMWNPLW